ncbi:MAG TPA: thermonuclease family protein [Candidatus Saccharimonadales bacterium]|jgi:micrococcal nuclease
MNRRRRSTAATLAVAVISLFIWYGQDNGWFASAQESTTKTVEKAKKEVQANQPGFYTITRYSDGDTITVDMHGTPETIRFIGVDTPETHDPRKKVQCYGPAASAFTKNALTAAGSKVRLAADSLSTNRDRYDRLLRYVYLPDGTNFNLKLIQDGYGFYYPYFKFDKSAEFDEAQKQAQAAGKGLWSNCMPTKTDGGGYVSNDQ